MHPVHRTIHRVHRISLAGLILSVLVALGLQLLVRPQNAFADQVGSRSIKMSNPVVNATNVNYLISFDISSSYGGNMKSYIVDFCQEDPLPGDVCTAPVGLDLSSATAVGGNTAGWTIATTASQLKVSDATGIAGGSTVSLELSGITNPSNTGTFFARIYTYSDSAFGGYTDPQNIGNIVDYGGVALSITTTISLTAFVQEEITFCVSGTLMANNCFGETPASVTIGHGAPPIVDGTQVDSNALYMQTSTNAQTGAQVRMKVNNACGGMSSDGGITCPVPPAGSSAISFNPGTADFGMNVGPSIGGLGAMNPTAPYNQNAATKFAMSINPASGVTSTYGSQIADSGTGCSSVNNALVFAAAASNITAADTYSADLTLIATGTF